MLSHRDDPDASHEAAAHIRWREEIKAAIVTILSERGQVSTFEIEAVYFSEAPARGWPAEIDLYSVRRRLSELHKVDGRVRVVTDVHGHQVRARFGTRKATSSVWELVPEEQPQEERVAA